MKQKKASRANKAASVEPLPSVKPQEKTFEQQSKEKKSVAMSSVLAGFALTVMKFVVGLLTGSIGILSEALHSLLDFAAAIMTYFAVKFGDAPADEKHPYGHGKVESVSALAETALLFLTSFWIIYEAVKRLVTGEVEIEVTWYAFAIVIISIIIDISRSRALMKTAKATKSQALEADALHFSSDIWSSLVVLIGLVLVSFGIKGGDAFAALLVAIFVMVAGYRLGKRTIDVLIDTAPAGIIETVTKTALKVPEVRKVERVRVRPMGPTTFVDLVVCVDRKLHFVKVQEIVAELEAAVHAAVPGADIVIHTKPLQLTKETLLESIQVLAARQKLSLHDIVVHKQKDGMYIGYDIEVPSTFSVDEAHAMATKLEDAIEQEWQGTEKIVVHSHIEPFFSDVITVSSASKKDIDLVQQGLAVVMKQVSPLADPHDLVVQKEGDGLFVSLHCSADGSLGLEDAHRAASRLEYLLREQVKGIKRVVVHVEPR